MTGTCSSRRLTSDRISRLFAWPRSPRNTTSWPDRMAFSTCGMTDPSYPMMPGKSTSLALILRTRFLRISSLTGRTRYSLWRSWAMVVAFSNANLFECGDAFRFYGCRSRSADFRSASPQLFVDRRGKLGQPPGERPQQPKAPGQHHVAVRYGQVRAQSRPVEEAAPRPRDREELGGRRDRSELQCPVPHVVEDRLVGQPAGGESVEVTLQLFAGELAGVVLEQPYDPLPVEEGGNRMEVSEVCHHRSSGRPDATIVERTQDGRR